MAALPRPVVDRKGRIAAWWGPIGAPRPPNFLATFAQVHAANDDPTLTAKEPA